MTRVYYNNDEHYHNEVGVPITNNLQHDQRRANLIHISNNEGASVTSWLNGVPFSKYCFYFGVTVSILFGVGVLIHAMTSQNSQQTCQCFASNHLSVTTVPNSLTVDTHSKLECSRNGEKQCQMLCLSLASKTPSVYKKKICEKERNASKYMALVHYRSCARDMWLQTALRITTCCKNGTENLCPRYTKYYN